MENIFRIILNLCGIVVSLGVVILFRQQVGEEKTEDRHFLRLIYIGIAAMILDSAFWLVDGRIFPGGQLWNRGINIAYFIIQTFFCHEWLVYCNKRLSYKSTHWVKIAWRIPLIVGIVIIAMNLKFDLFFRIDGDNVYSRITSCWGDVITVCCLIYPIYSVFLIIRSMVEGRNEKKYENSYLLLVVFVSISSTVIQLWMYGLDITWVGTALALFIVLIKGQLEENRRVRYEMMEQKTRLLVQQMQPHFLYNSLGTIRGLCQQQPDKVCEAIDHFSDYLRANMDSLTSQVLIPFREELEHLESYLYLERLRYGELLHIIYDITVDDFDVPQLAIQPLVENAIKHGIASRPEGGTVWIRTTQTAQGIQIEIEDDGVGYAHRIEEDNSETRSHLGIQNVRERIEKVAKGSFSIESQGGTKVTIVLPR